MPTAASTLATAAVAIICIAQSIVPTGAQTAETFYRGKSIKLHVSASPGGAYDLAGRIFAKHFHNYIPGRPTVIVLNMPGTISMPNWLYGVAEKDGTVIGLPNLSVAINQVIKTPNVRYDVTRFNWIGNLEDATGVVFTYHTSPTKTIRDAMARETPVGVPARSGTSYQLLAMSNKLLGTKFKIVAGYERNRVVAMESGELEGTASNIENLPGLAPSWVPNRLINILAVHAKKRIALAPEAPTMLELSTSDEHREMLEFTLLQSATARSIVAPPGVPDDRVEALRAAFDRTIKDPAYLADIEKAALGTNPRTGRETQQAIVRLTNTRPETISSVLEFMK